MTKGINPRDIIRVGTTRVTIYISKFTPIKTHTGFKSDL
jgi:hypothetical protein